MKNKVEEYFEQSPAKSHALWLYKGAYTYVQDIPYQDRVILFNHKIHNKEPHELELPDK